MYLMYVILENSICLSSIPQKIYTNSYDPRCCWQRSPNKIRRLHVPPVFNGAPHFFSTGGTTDDSDLTSFTFSSSVTSSIVTLVSVTLSSVTLSSDTTGAVSGSGF